MVAAVEGDLAPFQLLQSFPLVDSHRLRDEELPGKNVLSLRVRLARGLWSSVGADLPALRDDPEVAGSLVRLFGRLLRTMLMHLAARKAETATRLEAFMAGVDDPERLVEISGLLIDSADGEELHSPAGQHWRVRQWAPPSAPRYGGAPAAGLTVAPRSGGRRSFDRSPAAWPTGDRIRTMLRLVLSQLNMLARPEP